MAEEGRIVEEVMDGVALLTFAGPDHHNAVTATMWQALDAAVRRLTDDPAIRVLVLTGAGHVAFATDTGQDDPARTRGAEPARRGADDAVEPALAACASLAACEKPVLARLRGECIGAGLIVALHADIRIAARDSAFAIAAGRARALDAERLLAGVVGAAAARFLLLSGSRVEADEALRMGLVTRVVPDADLSDTVADLARQLADQDPGVLRATKRALSAHAPITSHGPPEPPPR